MKDNLNMVSSDVFENVSSKGHDERVSKRRRRDNTMVNDYSIINSNRFIDVMPKNSCKIGMINKKMYVVCLSREMVEENKTLKSKEKMVVHSLKTNKEEQVERYEDELARKYFMKMLFF